MWVVAFLQKCCYKWWPGKCLGLDMANLIIFISKKWPKNSLKITTLCVCVCVCVCLFFLFRFLKKKFQVRKIPQKNNKPHSNSNRSEKISISFGNFNIVSSENGNIVTMYSLFNFYFSYFCEIWHPTKKKAVPTIIFFYFHLWIALTHP